MAADSIPYFDGAVHWGWGIEAAIRGPVQTGDEVQMLVSWNWASKTLGGVNIVHSDDWVSYTHQQMGTRWVKGYVFNVLGFIDGFKGFLCWGFAVTEDNVR